MPKLTLRDLFAIVTIVTIVALALGWAVDRSRLDQRRFTAEMRYIECRTELTKRIWPEYARDNLATQISALPVAPRVCKSGINRR